METKKTKHIMIDLETMGSNSNAPIVSIGAVTFDPKTGITGEEFEVVVNLRSSAYYGQMDAATVTWWLQQSPEARAIFQKDLPKLPLKEALNQLNAWLESLGDRKELSLWGNGAGFDNVILMNAFNACRITPNFMHWNDLDVRTIVKMGKDILDINPKADLQREGVHHTALDDAKFQAKYVSEVWGKFYMVTCYAGDAKALMEGDA